MNNKTPKKIVNDSILDSSQREKLFALHSHRKTPSLKLKDPLALSSIFLDQSLVTPRQDYLVGWSVSKTPQRASQEIPNLQPSNSSSRPTSKHARSNSTLMIPANFPNSGTPLAVSKKSDKVLVSPKQSHEKSIAMRELYKVPKIPEKKTPRSGVARKSSCSVIPAEFVSPKNEKDLKDSIENLANSLKGVVFSDTKNRLSKYQRRFLELNGDSMQGPVESMSTPKVIHKRETSTPKGPIKVNSSKQTQMLLEALEKGLHGKSPSHSMSRPGTPSQGQGENEAKVDVMPSSVKHHKRGMSVCQAPIFIAGEEEKEMEKIAREEKMRQEQAREEHMRAVQEELEHYNQFLCIDRQTFNFEKMMVMRREAKKTQRGTGSMAVGESCGDVDVRDRETMLRSMFAYYSKESEKQTPTGESSKNQQGSTTCNSSKNTSEMTDLRREARKKQEEDREFEKLLEIMGSTKSPKPRVFKQEEF